MWYTWSLLRKKDEICQSGYSVFQIDYKADQDPDENDFTLESTDNSFSWCTAEACSGTSGSRYDDENKQYEIDVCIPDGKTYTFTFTDSGGDGFNGGTAFVALSLLETEIYRDISGSFVHTFSTRPAPVQPLTPAPNPPTFAPTNLVSTVLIVMQFDSTPDDISVLIRDAASRLTYHKVNWTNAQHANKLWTTTLLLVEGGSYKFIVEDDNCDGLSPGYFAVYYGNAQNSAKLIFRRDSFDGCDTEVSFVVQDPNPTPTSQPLPPTQQPVIPTPRPIDVLPTSPGESLVQATFLIQFDEYPDETGFSLTDSSGRNYFSFAAGTFQGTYANQQYQVTVTLVEGRTYQLTVTDSGSDGLGENGNAVGYFALYFGTSVVGSAQIIRNDNFITASVTTSVTVVDPTALPPSSQPTTDGTPQPTGAATPAPTGGFTMACFSGETIVQVEGRGPVHMKDLHVGDRVLGKDGQFEQIYSFGHRDENKSGEYLRLMPFGLELSENHMVFIQNRGFIPAVMVQVGDLVSSGNRVEAIQTVERKGLYAPFTLSGMIVVNGVLSSNFISFQNSDVIKFGSWRSPFSYQWLSHSFLAIHRLWFCWMGQNDNMSEVGIASWLGLPCAIMNWFLVQHPVIMLILFLPFVSLLMVFWVLETLVLHPWTVIMLAFLHHGSVFLLKQRSRNYKTSG
mmetsp:Transcript_41556/g.58488  ORF Transcript_41556/g.58488 Transcript_41556/m.58488 type:complete len:679 (-) Transcript_41556:244-2280(-)